MSIAVAQPDVDVRQIEEAVAIFYKSGSAQHAAAHQYLNQWAARPEAWSFVWDLLKVGKPMEVQFFGATTLHTKMTRFWSEVPPENYEDLKMKVMDAIVLFGAGPRLVLSRLCQALSVFIIQMYPVWPMGVESVTASLQHSPLPNIEAKMQVWILMEILTAIPDEMTVTVSADRPNLRQNLSNKAPYVMGVLEQYMESLSNVRELTTHDMETLTTTAKCACAWLRNYSFSLDACMPLATKLTHMVANVYWKAIDGEDGCLLAEDNEFAEWALDALTAMHIQPDAERYSFNALLMIKLFLDALEPITKAEHCEDNLNEDIASAIYTLFITSIESHSSALITGCIADSPEHNAIFERLVAQIMQCTDKPGCYPIEESCSQISLGFWFMLQDEIVSQTAGREKMVTLVTPAYAHLVTVLLRKSQLPDDESLGSWSAEDLEMFRCYRQDISDTFLYCHEILHAQMLAILTDRLADAVGMVRVDARNWPQLESVLHAFCAISEQIDCDERVHTPQLIKVITEVPYARMGDRMLGSAMDTIGSFSEWFKYNTDYLPAVVDLLVRGLSSTQASQATLGLKDICSDCQPQLRPYTSELLMACERSLSSGHLNRGESVRLMFSIGKLMSMLSEAQLVPSLDALVSPCFSDLKGVVEKAEVTPEISGHVLYRVNMISTLFTSLNTSPEVTKMPAIEQGEQPVLMVMQRTMPIMRGIGELFLGEAPLMEALCACFRQAVTNLQNDILPLVPEMCEFVLAMMRKKCSSPLLDLTKTCVLHFFREKSCHDAIRNLYVEVSAGFLGLMLNKPIDQVAHITDLVESFYALNQMMAKKLPDAFKLPGIDNTQILHNAIIAMLLSEPSTLKNAVGFIAHYVIQSTGIPAAKAAVLQLGSHLVRTVFDCIGSLTPRTNIDQFADILLAVCKKYPDQYVQWLQQLQQADWPTALITPAQKEQFRLALLKERVNKRIIQAQIREFAARCRGLPLTQN